MNKTLYVLVADTGRAKVYKARLPLTSASVIYDQLNFNAHLPQAGQDPLTPPAGAMPSGNEAFARSLSRFLQTEHKSGKFNYLVLLGEPAVLGSVHQQLDRSCRAALLATQEGISIRTGVQELVTFLRENCSSTLLYE